MRFPRERLEELIYGGQMARRFTQDSPILPDVWFEFAQKHEPVDLLITPFQVAGEGSTTPGKLSVALRERLNDLRTQKSTDGFPPMKDRGSPRIAYNQSTVLARLWFDELIRAVLPLSRWWNERVVETGIIGLLSDPGEVGLSSENPDLVMALNDAGPAPLGTPSPYFMRIQEEQRRAIAKLEEAVADLEEPHKSRKEEARLSPDILWMLRVVGTIALATRISLAGAKTTEGGRPTAKKTARKSSKAKADAKGRAGRDAEERDWPPPAAKPADWGEEEHREERHQFLREVINAAVSLIRGLDASSDEGGRNLVHTVTLNRRASTSVSRSRITVKADSAMRVFDLRCDEIIWAVIDSGIDASHPAFRLRKGSGVVVPADPTEAAKAEKSYLYEPAFKDNQLQSRVLETYDFTRIQHLLSLDEIGDDETSLPSDLGKRLKTIRAEVEARKKGKKRRGQEVDEVDDPLHELRRSLQKGRDVDWSLLEPFVRVHHLEADEPLRPRYAPPENEHGTHVAGILGGEWGDRLRGVCPDIRMIDIRVLDGRGQGDEFNVIAALQFVRYLRGKRDYATIHGVNLSLSIRHDVANYACGRTPVCEECERLIGNGLVVVAAAGNEGYQQYTTPKGPLDAYRSISITDPGNAEGVITVGATHRFQPHTYGVSYFSSRGPTGDGRAKPDLVAPGEKIEAPVPGDPPSLRRMDGTSMATPHVSGAAALLIARHRELAGQPEKIKQILCKTATDLGRERYFQGHGMVDILRALQSI